LRCRLLFTIRLLYFDEVALEETAFEEAAAEDAFEDVTAEEALEDAEAVEEVADESVCGEVTASEPVISSAICALTSDGRISLACRT